MAIDESFKKPGSIPFKWEIRPGVPKQQTKQSSHSQPQLASPPRKLRPPPSAEPRSDSFLSAPRARSDRYDVATSVSVGCFAASPLMKRKPSVKKSGDGCYVSGFETPCRWSVSSSSSAVSPFRDSPAASPLMRRMPSVKKRSNGGYVLDVETPFRLSVSSRKSAVSPFRESPATSFCGSSPSPSPKLGSNSEWAGFGLF